MFADRSNRRSRRSAFSLVSLTSLVLLCSGVAALGLPRLMHCAERARAEKAFGYLEHIHQLQQAHHLRTGHFATDPLRLDLALVPPVDFTLSLPSEVSDEAGESWRASLVRQGASRSYGEYRITFDQNGYAPHRSTIGHDLLPLTDTESFHD